MNQSAGKPEGKKKYVSPKLETFGSVEGLTGQKTGVQKAHLGQNGGDFNRPFSS